MIAGRKRRSTPEAHVSRKRYARDVEGRRPRLSRRSYNQIYDDQGSSSPRAPDGHIPEPFPSIPPDAISPRSINDNTFQSGVSTGSHVISENAIVNANSPRIANIPIIPVPVINQMGTQAQPSGTTAWN